MLLLVPAEARGGARCRSPAGCWAGDIPTPPARRASEQRAPCGAGRAPRHLQPLPTLPPCPARRDSHPPPAQGISQCLQAALGAPEGKPSPEQLLPFPIIRRKALLNPSVPAASHEAGAAPLYTRTHASAGNSSGQRCDAAPAAPMPGVFTSSTQVQLSLHRPNSAPCIPAAPRERSPAAHSSL